MHISYCMLPMLDLYCELVAGYRAPSGTLSSCKLTKMRRVFTQMRILAKRNAVDIFRTVMCRYSEDSIFRRTKVLTPRTNIHHHHHLFAQYAEMNSKICNVPDRKANSFSSNNCP